MIYEDSTSSFDTLFEKDMSFSVHDRNIQQDAPEMYKVRKGLAPTAISSLLLQCSNNRHTRSQSDFSVPQVNTVYFGQNSIKVFRTFKGCTRDIFASLFCVSKREYLSNKEKYFLFHFENSFCS